MAKKKKEVKKVANRGAKRKVVAVPVFKLKARSIGASKLVAAESKGTLAKGMEWYDDGGNEGLKQRPVS